MVKDEDVTKVEDTNKLREIFRCISGITEYGKSKEIIERNWTWEGWGKNKGAKLIDDYEIGGNLGLGGGRVRNAIGGNQLGGFPT